MDNKTAALVACGDIGTRLAERLHGSGWRCLGLRRDPRQLTGSIEAVAADVTDPASLQVLATEQPALLLFTPTPLGRGAEGYALGFASAARNVVSALAGHVPALAILVSSTRVYAERDGGWVNEDSALHHADPHAGAIIAAENAFLEALPSAVVLRAGGLYGQGPGYLLRRVAAGELSPAEPLRYSNRIHRDDLVDFIHYLQEQRPQRERIYNLVDDDPAPQQQVEAWLCEQLGQPYRPSAQGAGETRGHKRISNRRLRGSGFSLQYPDFRAGYTAVLRRAGMISQGEDSLDLD